MQRRLIEKPRLILGEGTEDCRFLEILIRAWTPSLPVDEYQLFDFGGKYTLSAYLEALRRQAGFGNVQSLLITVDADQDAQGAFDRAADALHRIGLAVPSAPGTFAGSNPKVAIWVFPDNGSAGYLETLCRRALASHPLARCVDRFMECCPTAAGQIDKAWVYAFLACQPDPRRRLGELGPNDLRSWNLSVFGTFIQLVRQM